MASNSTLFVDKSKTRIFIENFIGGLAWGLGSVVGAFVLFAILGYVASKIHTVPIIGEIVYNILTEVEKLRGK